MSKPTNLASKAACAVGASAVLFAACVLPALAEDAGHGSFNLAPGDTVKFDILDDDALPVDLEITTDGNIQAPFLGEVAVTGLTAAEAKQELERRYIENEIFLTPKIALSVAEYRPVFVIGDVKNPGSYPFQPQLNVEKATGLAGGQLILSSTENPVLARTRLRGELDALGAEIAREGIAYARLSATLDDRSDIDVADVPEDARPYMDEDVAASMRAIELQILQEGITGHKAKRNALEETLEEAKRGFELVKKLYDKMEVAISLSREDLERARGLQERGIQTLSNVSGIERQLAMEEGRQLQVLSQISDERREIGELKRKLAELDHTRRLTALNELQQHNANLSSTLAKRRAVEEQLALLSNMTEEDQRKHKEVVLDYTIRRTTQDGVVNVNAEPRTLLVPGDVVVVRIRDEDEDAAVAALPGSTAPSAQ